MLLHKLVERKILHPGTNVPKWLPDNTQYLVQMGSVAYGVSGGNSDYDVYGITIPPKHITFPHLSGAIPGFGHEAEKFEQWQMHHLKDVDAGREYDFKIYSIIKYFDLVSKNNPEMIDSLFVPARCILHMTHVGETIRESRREFLSKASFHKFRGYAFQQMAKIEGKNNSSNPKRAKLIEEFGFDTKFAYHVVRLALEAEQILEEGDLDVERNREILKAVRRGEWTLDYLKEWFTVKERELDALYQRSTFRHKPDLAALQDLLHRCLEAHYGSIDDAVKRQVPVERLMRELDEVLSRYR